MFIKNLKSISTTTYKIKQISAKETHAVRHPVLRAGKPIESCVFDGDDLETTIHLGIFETENLLGICSFFKNSNPIILETSQYQLRGMAILKAFQNKGLGKLLLKHGEHVLKNKNVKIVWCNARKVALNFYKNNNYQITGNPFTIKDIGLHYIMYKKL